MQTLFHFIISILVATELNMVKSVCCIRDPEDTQMPQSVNNRFKIGISGNPDKYVPGEVYAVTLRGQHIGDYQPAFKSFTLVIEPSCSHLSPLENGIFRHRNLGNFTLMGTDKAQYSNHCPNAITQISSERKTEVNVTWTAPTPGSGCIVFRATVSEDNGVWHKDDGSLSLVLCEDVHKDEFDQPKFDFHCCACDDALYEMTFEGLWSKYTHPKDFPQEKSLIGFTDLIGASHSSDFCFWDYGNLASEGLKLVAEFGDTHVLESEIMDKSDLIRTIIKARGLRYPNVTGKTHAVFRVDKEDHLVSVVSRIDPSPDWIVGVSGLNLCLKNCSWVNYMEMNLHPWDAGTDSGITYTSPDEPTSPHQAVRSITSSYANDPHSPFYDPSESDFQPFARLYLRRQQSFEKQCNNEIDPGTEPSPVDCAVSEWSKWSPCSVTCGAGKRSRHRSYLDKMRSDLMACNRTLHEQDICYAQKVCNLSENVCTLTEWSAWSSCSVSCGNGEKIRTRHYKSRRDYRRCSHCPNPPELEQKITCQGSEGPVCDEEYEFFSSDGMTYDSDFIVHDHIFYIKQTDDCPATKWSLWSPCSASCGKGKSIREKIPVLETEPAEEITIDCPELHVIEEKDCVGEFPSCEMTPQMYREFCGAPLEEGGCHGQNIRWFFDVGADTCVQFIYKGCSGNRNNFLTKEDCENTCKGYKGLQSVEQNAEDDTMMPSPFNGLLPSSHIIDLNTTTYGLMVSTIPAYNFESETEPITLVEGEIVDCIVSRWSRWSKCSVSCGHGYRKRSRSIVVHPRNGGKACPRLIKNKKCRKKCEPQHHEKQCIYQ